jgi:hypothetical protein
MPRPVQKREVDVLAIAVQVHWEAKVDKAAFST